LSTRQISFIDRLIAVSAVHCDANTCLNHKINYIANFVQFVSGTSCILVYSDVQSVEQNIVKAEQPNIITFIKYSITNLYTSFIYRVHST